jgi:hypothetical protein
MASTEEMKFSIKRKAFWRANEFRRVFIDAGKALCSFTAPDQKDACGRCSPLAKTVE